MLNSIINGILVIFLKYAVFFKKKQLWHDSAGLIGLFLVWYITTGKSFVENGPDCLNGGYLSAGKPKGQKEKSESKKQKNYKRCRLLPFCRVQVSEGINSTRIAQGVFFVFKAFQSVHNRCDCVFMQRSRRTKRQARL